MILCTTIARDDSSTYEDLLGKLDMVTLEQRRVRANNGVLLLNYTMQPYLFYDHTFRSSRQQDPTILELMQSLRYL